MTDDDSTSTGPARDLDRDETHQDTGANEPPRSRTYRAFRWLSENFLLVASVSGLAAFVVASMIGYNPPRNLKLIGVTALIVIPVIGRPTGKKVRSLLWDPNYIWLIDLDARYQKGAIYRTTSQRFREWDVTDGQLDWLTPNLAVGKNVDLVEQTIAGTWRGTMTDRQLLRALQAVEECRGQLEDDAKRGFAIEAQAFTIIRNATRKAVMSVISTFERGSLPDEGEGITDEINSAIEQFGLERKIRRDEDDEAPDSDVPGVNFQLDPDLADLSGASEGGATADD